MSDIYKALDKKYGGEDGLTYNMMSRAISDLSITDSSLLDVIHESVSFYTRFSRGRRLGHIGFKDLRQLSQRSDRK